MSAKISSISGSGKPQFSSDPLRFGGNGDIHDLSKAPEKSMKTNRAQMKLVEKFLAAKDPSGQSAPAAPDKWMVDQLVDAMENGLLAVILAGKLKKKFGGQFSLEEEAALKEIQEEARCLFAETDGWMDARIKKPGGTISTPVPEPDLEPFRARNTALKRKAENLALDLHASHSRLPERGRSVDEIGHADLDRAEELKPFVKQGLLVRLYAQNLHALSQEKPEPDVENAKEREQRHQKYLILSGEWQKWLNPGRV